MNDSCWSSASPGLGHFDRGLLVRVEHAVGAMPARRARHEPPGPPAAARRVAGAIARSPCGGDVLVSPHTVVSHVCDDELGCSASAPSRAPWLGKRVEPALELLHLA